MNCTCDTRMLDTAAAVFLFLLWTCPVFPMVNIPVFHLSFDICEGRIFL